MQSLRVTYLLPLLGFSALSIMACGGDDPVSVSAPIGINLKAEEGDVKDNNVINVEKGISTESGNPWGAFMKDVDDQLGGPAGDIALEKVELSLAASSVGVTSLSEVFDGLIEIQFVMNDSGNFFTVASATVDADTTGRTIALDSSFDYLDYQGVDLDKLDSGSFKVVLGAPAEAGFMALKAKAELQITFSFAAYE